MLWRAIYVCTNPTIKTWPMTYVDRNILTMHLTNRRQITCCKRANTQSIYPKVGVLSRQEEFKEQTTDQVSSIRNQSIHLPDGCRGHNPKLSSHGSGHTIYKVYITRRKLHAHVSDPAIYTPVIKPIMSVAGI
jgi:hypothetical protein